MAVRLHRASPLRKVERLHLALPDPAGTPERDENEIETPRLGTPTPTFPAFPPPPTVSLRPVQPIRIESPTRKLSRRAALAGVVIAAATWIGASLGAREDVAVTMTASVLDPPRTVVADADGSLSSVAAVGAVLEPGSAIAEFATAEAAVVVAEVPPPAAVAPAAAELIERELERIARDLKTARRAQVEIEKLYKSERATRSEREEAGAAVRALVAKRERLMAERKTDAVAVADAVAVPVAAPATLRSDRHAIIREVLRETGAVKKGDPIAIVVGRTVRAAAPLTADAESPANAGDAAHVTAGTRAFDATVVGVEIGPHGRQLVVEFDPGADRPKDGDAVEIRLAAERSRP